MSPIKEAVVLTEVEKHIAHNVDIRNPTMSWLMVLRVKCWAFNCGYVFGSVQWRYIDGLRLFLCIEE